MNKSIQHSVYHHQYSLRTDRLNSFSQLSSLIQNENFSDAFADTKQRDGTFITYLIDQPIYKSAK